MNQISHDVATNGEVINPNYFLLVLGAGNLQRSAFLGVLAIYAIKTTLMSLATFDTTRYRKYRTPLFLKKKKKKKLGPVKTVPRE